MKCLILILLCAIAFQSESTWSNSMFPNEPVGSTPILDWSFQTVEGNGLVDSYHNGQVTFDPTAPSADKMVLNQVLPAGSASGGAQMDYALPQLDEVFAAVWWKPNSDFEGMSNSSNKIFFVSNNDNGALLNWYGGRDQERTVGYHFQMNWQVTNNCHLPNILLSDCSFGYGGTLILGGNTGQSGIAGRGEWHKLELYVKRSSTNTSRDGVVRWWLDSRLIGDYRNANTGQSKWNRVSITHAWDGSFPAYAPTKTWSHEFDHLYISAPNGGNIPIPMPQPQPQPQPVPQPAPMASVGIVNDLSVVSTTSNSVDLSFTEINEGAGAPAKYDLRYGPAGSNWGAMTSVNSGSCAVPIAGSQVGAKKSCTVSGLTASTQYQFQIVAFSGTMNQGAVYGGLSSVASATTSAGSNPQPQPQPQPSNGAPVVQFTFPNVGAVLSDQVFVYAQVGSSVAISEVRFFVDGLQVGPEIKQAPYSLLLDTHRISNGAHQISAIAKDISGVSSVAAKVDVIVSNSNGGSAAYDPLTAAAGCVMGQTKTNQINASMSLIWLLPLAGLMRRRRK